MPFDYSMLFSSLRALFIHPTLFCLVSISGGLLGFRFLSGLTYDVWRRGLVCGLFSVCSGMFWPLVCTLRQLDIQFSQCQSSDWVRIIMRAASLVSRGLCCLFPIITLQSCPRLRSFPWTCVCFHGNSLCSWLGMCLNLIVRMLRCSLWLLRVFGWVFIGIRDFSI